MPILSKSPSGTVTGLWGSAFVKLPGGKLKPLQMGDQVKPGEQIITTQDGIVQITNPKGKVAEVKPVAPATNLDRDIAALESGEEATAAGLTGGGEGGLTPGLRVDRVSESVTQLSFQFGTERPAPEVPVGVTQPLFFTDEVAPPPLPTVSGVSSPTVTEGGDLDFLVTLSNPPTGAPTQVVLQLNSGTATVGVDTGLVRVSLDGGQTFQQVQAAIDGTITVTVPVNTPANAIVVRVPTIADGISEGSETVTLTASTPQNTAPASGTGTINDGDDVPTVSINDVDVNEGAGQAVFTLTLSGPSSTDVRVVLRTVDATATSVGDKDGDKDFNPLTDITVVIPAGQTSVTVPVTINNDAVYEQEEVFGLQIVSTTGNAVIGKADGLGTITDSGNPLDPKDPTQDDDRPVVAGVSDASAGEGNNLEFTVTLSNPSDVAVAVNLRLLGKTATLGEDTGSVRVSVDGGKNYFLADVDSQGNFQVMLPPGAAIDALRVQVPTVADNISEGNETLELTAQTLRDVQANTSETGTGTIVDDDGLPTLRINDVEVNEAAGVAIFTVTLSHPSSKPVTVDYATKDDGYAKAGEDYTATSGTLTFQPGGPLTQTITVKITNDNIYEGLEQYEVLLSNVSNTATIDKGTGIGGINDEGGPETDPPGPNVPPGTPDNDYPTVGSINSPSVEEGEDLNFVVTLSNPVDMLVPVRLALTGGTPAEGKATLGVDTGAVEYSIDGGATYKTAQLEADGTFTVELVPSPTGAPVDTILVRVKTVDDTLTEGTETLTLSAQTLRDEFNNTPVVTGTGTIADNDGPPVIDLDDNNSSGASGTGYQAIYTENGAPITIADADVLITDLDSPMIKGATIQLSNPQAGDILSVVGALPAGITASVEGNKITLVGNASQADYQAAIRQIGFANSSDAPATVDRIITVTVTDGTSNSAPATATITVRAANDAPKAVDDNVSTEEDKPIEVQVRNNDTDADGDALTVTGVTQGAHGSVVINPQTGNPVYTPNLDYVGTDSFTYTVKDPSGATSTATVTVTVGGVNDAPVAQDDVGQVGQNAVLTVNAANGVILSGANPAGRDTDADNDSLTVTAVSFNGTPGTVGTALQGQYGTLVLRADGSYTYTPNDTAKALDDGETGRDVFTYTVKDGGGLADTATLTVTVTGANDAPVAVADNATTPEDTTVVVRVLDNDKDIDGDTLTITKIGSQDVTAGSTVTLTGAGGVEIAKVTVNADGTLTVDPAANYNGPLTFKYTISDGTATSEAQVNVVVDSRNDPPVADDDVVEGLEDTKFSFDPRANDTDPEGDALRITHINGQPISTTQGVTLNDGVLKLNANGTLEFTPKADFNGEVSFEYTVSDGKGGTDTATVRMNVKPVNDPPEVTDTPSNPGGPGSSFDPVTGNYSYTTPEDTPVRGQVKATDKDNDPLTFTKGSDPSNGTVTVNPDGTWTYTPKPDYNGSDSFTVVVSDGHGGTDTSTITIGVTPVNDPPKPEDPNNPNFDPSTGNYSVTTPEDTPVNGQVKATDKDGDALTYESGEQPLHGTVTVRPDGTWTYTPGPNYNGSDSFTVVIDDGHGGTATSTVNIGITPVNDAPVLTPQTASVSEEGLAGGLIDNAGSPSDTTNASTVSGKVSAFDPDGTAPTSWTLEAPTTALTSGGVAVSWSGNGTQTLTATAGNVTVGTLTIDNNGNYTFTLKAPLDHPIANAEDVLPLNFTVRASDGQLSGSTTLTINVEDDAPSNAVSQSRDTSVIDTNIMVILDMSTSMNTTDGVNGTTRLASAIASINALLDKYDALGDVRVRLVTFGTNAEARGDVWTTVSEARAILAGLGTTAPTNQGTNYDEALGDAITAFASAGKLTTGQNVSYFISDGAPTYGSGTASQLTPAGQSPGTPATNGTGNSQTGTDTGIQAAEEAIWKTFLTTNGVNSYALGVGGVTEAQRTFIDPIAYDGKANAERNGVVVTAFSQLDNVLGSTVPTPISGNLLSGSLLPSGGAGADGPAFIKSVTINGVTYTYNPANGGSITVTGGTSAGVFDTTTDTLTVTTRQADGSVGGKFIIDMDGGDYRYEVPPAVAVRNISEVMQFTISDRDGDTTSASLTVNVTNQGAPTPNDPPVVTSQTASVSEEGLTGGVADNTGSPTDTTNAKTVSGTMTASDPDGNAITGWTLEAPTTALTSGGVAVTWAGSGTQTLTATAGSVTVGTLTISNTGAYTFTLNAPLDHPEANAEDVIALNFKALASDGRANGSGTLTINVEDDSPSAAVAQTQTATAVDTNVMVILDMSTSMNTTDGVNGTTRLASAIASINALLDKYDALGDVRVRLVTFGTNAEARGDVWTTVEQARAILNGLGNTAPTNQGTNYDEALGDAITAFASAGKLSSGQNVSYFISDGAPTYGSGTTSQLTPAGQSPGTPPTNGSGNTQTGSDDTGIQAAEETLWKNFLVANQIDSFALGVGGVTTAQRTYLDPIAYDGRAVAERNGVIVSAFSKLDGVLASTVPASVNGNLLSGSFLAAGGSLGADAPGYVKSLTVNGVTYTYDPANGGSITVSGGTSAGVFDTTTDTLTITTRLADGSVGGKFIVDMDGGDYRYEVPPTVPAAGASEVLGFVISDRDGDTSGSTLTVNVSKPTITNGTAGADTLSGGSGIDFITGGEGNDTLNGGAGDDKLYGNNGDDIVNGGAGNDVLHGGSGNDTVNGGEGNDLLIGGAGNDVLTGGLGTDVFQWTLADPGTSAATRAVDTVKDFNVAAASAGGDVLDLRDLLTGENTTGGAGNLQNYLDFDTSGSNTVIRISPTGAFSNGTYAATNDHQQIVLEGVNIRTGLGLAANATDAQIITKLIQDGKLLVDN
jgi:T1SS-143 domain-containing protein